MPLTIKPSSGSGSSTLISVAGTTTNDTLTLPAKTGNIITSADSGTVTQTMLSTNVAGNGPAFYAYSSSSQSITLNTWTKVQLNSVSSPGFNINNNFDATTNYRFTPTVAGYYQITIGTGITSAVSTFFSVSIYKNGSAQVNPFQGTANMQYLAGAGLIYMNGTTDYIESYFYCGSSVSTQAVSSITFMSGFLARAA